MNAFLTPPLRVSALMVAVLLLGYAHQALAVCADGNENAAVPATAPTTSFTDNDNGTVTDKTTGLMWKRCSEGQAWSGSTCIGTLSSHIWEEALTQAEAAEFAGFNDWRLPNKNELRSIVEQRCYSPSVSVDIFPETPGDLFWSSSSYVFSDTSFPFPFISNFGHFAWVVSFGAGYAELNYKLNSNRVRLVRGGE